MYVPDPFSIFIGTLKEVWSSGNWGEPISFKVFFSIGLFICSFFIPKIIKKIRPENKLETRLADKPVS